MTELILRLIRLFDKTAFICPRCLKIKRGWGIRVGRGRVCSDSCYQDLIEEYTT